MKRFKLLFSFLKGSIGIYTLAIILCLMSVGISLLVPLIVRVVIDSVIGSEPFSESGFIAYLFRNRTGVLLKDILTFSFLGVAFVAISSIMEFIYIALIAIASQRAGKKMKDRMYKHIQRLDYEYHAKAEIGDLIQRCTTDIENSMLFLSEHFINILRVIFIMGITISLMLSLNVTMSFISMALVPFIFLYSVNFFKKAQKVFEEQEKTDAILSSVLQENLTGVRVVKAFARQEYEIDKFEIANRNLRERTMDIIKAMSQFWSASDGLSMLQIGVVLGVGSYFVVSGMFGIGMIIAFFTYVERIMWPVKQLGRLLAESGKTSVSLKRLQEILDTNPEVLDDSNYKPQLQGKIEFRNVSFTYPNGTEVLNNVSFVVEKGQSAAIIGPTGSGKTTLVHLLHRLYDNYTGTILVDDMDIRTISKRHLRENLSLILQEPFLFNKSVKDNISYAKEESNDDEIFNATETACIHNSINEFDKGYETLVGEGGVTLSGGQKQRIAIARTLICNNPVVIFDDSLSAVDTETDKVIRTNLKDGDVRPTSIIISHRVSTVRDADKIIVLERGVVTADGTHNEIKDQDNLYRRILNIQSEIEEEFHTKFA
ncbi:ABC transporter ATP-binding protein [Thiospirochaeta perfilievii]|uniref:ABC transporter ATP-binding protein n=1 Tax=Thiospirochaeta perfilievii TaxID=252967 RepID=A0A5C1QC90_9SPIO|nr:ABC transporter ATP-binding protein [Thiospirochaeta perfilievii]QEN04720.1 ABC transporter ATP-binding protein [Thiospirochaeta perfilievii]